MKAERVNNRSNSGSAIASFAQILGELRMRQTWLFYFSVALTATLPFLLLAMAFDQREYRGVSIWLKPSKFAVSLMVFSLTTAWFVGLLPKAKRDTRSVRVIALTLIATSLFELIYIGVQAGLGSASHYNVSNRFHAAMFTAMAVAAWALTGTQAALALQIARHSERNTYTVSVMIGLWLTFVLGSLSGMMLGGMQPPAGTGIPILGWQFDGGDIRPAHFWGIHAHQLFPLVGFWLYTCDPTTRYRTLMLLALIYVTMWVAWVALGYSKPA
jgi:hypothetical protein